MATVGVKGLNINKTFASNHLDILPSLRVVFCELEQLSCSTRDVSLPNTHNVSNCST